MSLLVKNFENLSIFSKVMGMSRLSCFFDSRTEVGNEAGWAQNGQATRGCCID